MIRVSTSSALISSASSVESMRFSLWACTRFSSQETLLLTLKLASCVAYKFKNLLSCRLLRCGECMSFRFSVLLSATDAAAAATLTEAADFEAVCTRELAALLSFVGEHQHLYICGVNRAFHTQYHKTKAGGRRFLCRTSYRAVFESASRLTLAVQCGLVLNRLQYEAGRYASIEVLQAALSLGLLMTGDVVRGAVHSGVLSKSQWLADEQKVALSDDLADETAKTGSVEIMQWLHTRPVLITSQALRVAARSNHLPMVEYLGSFSTILCQLHPRTAVEVAEEGHLDMLKWLQSHRCAMEFEDIAFHAAKGGHVHILAWLLEDHGVDLSATRALARAARGGHLLMMGWLIMQGCDVDAEVCLSAVHGALRTGVTALNWLLQHGHLMLTPLLYKPVFSDTGKRLTHRLKVLKWLREVAHCPWDAVEAAKCAAMYGHLECLQYIHQHGGPFTPQQLTAQLRDAGRLDHLAVAQWLRDTQRAPWPAHLRNCSWPEKMVRWARSAGYVGP